MHGEAGCPVSGLPQSIRQIELEDRGRTLLIRLPYGPVVVPINGQRWPGPAIAALLSHYVQASASTRSSLAHPSVIESLPLALPPDLVP